jgi:hypothetical protein
VSEPDNADMVSFMAGVHTSVLKMIRNALAHGFALQDMLIIADGTPSLDVPVSVGWLEPAALERSLHKAATERFREAGRALLDLERLNADHVHVLYYTAEWWSTARLLVPADDLVTVKGAGDA